MALGQFDETRRYAQQAQRQNPEDSTVNYNLACLYCGMGDFDNALNALRISLEQTRSRNSVDWLKYDSDLDPMRNLPEFQALLKTIKFE